MMNRLSFLRRSAVIALASMFMDVKLLEPKWESDPVAAPFDRRAEFERQLKYQEAKVWRELRESINDHFYRPIE